MPTRASAAEPSGAVALQDADIASSSSSHAQRCSEEQRRGGDERQQQSATRAHSGIQHRPAAQHATVRSRASQLLPPPQYLPLLSCSSSTASHSRLRLCHCLLLRLLSVSSVPPALLAECWTVARYIPCRPRLALASSAASPPHCSSEERLLPARLTAAAALSRVSRQLAAAEHRVVSPSSQRHFYLRLSRSWLQPRKHRRDGACAQLQWPRRAERRPPPAAPSPSAVRLVPVFSLCLSILPQSPWPHAAWLRCVNASLPQQQVTRA